MAQSPEAVQVCWDSEAGTGTQGASLGAAVKPEVVQA